MDSYYELDLMVMMSVMGVNVFEFLLLEKWGINVDISKVVLDV